MSAATTAAAPAKPGETRNSRSGTGDSIACGILVIGLILPYGRPSTTARCGSSPDALQRARNRGGKCGFSQRGGAEGADQQPNAQARRHSVELACPCGQPGDVAAVQLFGDVERGALAEVDGAVAGRC